MTNYQLQRRRKWNAITLALIAAGAILVFVFNSPIGMLLMVVAVAVACYHAFIVNRRP